MKRLTFVFVLAFLSGAACAPAGHIHKVHAPELHTHDAPADMVTTCTYSCLADRNSCTFVTSVLNTAFDFLDGLENGLPPGRSGLCRYWKANGEDGLCGRGKEAYSTIGGCLP